MTMVRLGVASVERDGGERGGEGKGEKGSFFGQKRGTNVGVVQ